jgi:hypothetical protein
MRTTAWILLGALMMPAQDDPAPRANGEPPGPAQADGGGLTPKQLQIARDNIELLNHSDPQIRQAARRTLLEFGSKVRPLLLERLRQLKAMDVHSFLEELEKSESIPPPTAAELEGVDPELRWFVSIPKMIQPLPRRSADAYLLGKLYEAFRATVRGEYEAAERTLTAIRILDPAWSQADRVTELLRHAQARIVEGRVLRPTATVDRTAVKNGDPIKVELRIANPFDGTLTISQNGVVKPVVHAQVSVGILHFEGGEEGMHHPLVFPFPERVALDPGQAWTQTVTIETASDYKADRLRIYTIHFATADVKIEAKGGPMVRKIHFPPVTAKAVPVKYARYLADPLQSLTDTMKGEGIDGGLVEEVFLCLMLLPDGEPLWRGVARVMAVVQSAPESVAARAGLSMLSRATGYRAGTSTDAWLKWWAEKKKALAEAYPNTPEFR